MNFLQKSLDFIGKFKAKFIEFFKENFIISSTKSSRIFGFVLGLVSLLLVAFCAHKFVALEFSAKWILLALDLVFPFVLFFFAAFKVNFTKQSVARVFQLISLLLMPIVTMTMTECLNNVFIYNMTYLGFFANYLVILVLNFLVFAISGSVKWAYLIVNPILYGLALGHSYVMDFRGTPFLPMDFLSITTAVGVANTYDYTPTYKTITGTFLFLLIMLACAKMQKVNFNLITKVISRSFTGTFSVVLIILFFGTSVFADMGVRPDFWNQTRGYKNYGFVWNFFCNTKYLYMSEPNDYNSENVKDYVDKVSPNTPQIDDSYEKPNIICIMNESLSDLSVLGELTTNEDYMPFMRSLSENTIRGNLYVPVIGAGTSNTEFEFLTGHTTAFLPSGSNAYMLYVKNPIASLVSTLEAQGYSSWALHPYYADGWRRTDVYNNFGFNDFISLEDILSPEVLADYKSNGSDADYVHNLVEQNYPGSNMLLRQYVSDAYNYDLLIEDFKNRDKSVPYFAFNVTMQNHGGYTTSAENFTEEIYSTSASQDYIKANKYLSLVKKSDDAFKDLIEYFETVKEPTVICMFGDHQPTIETEFIEEVMGVSNLSSLTPEQEQQRYCTPFFIWANYDIEEREIERLSSNYLSSLVLETAGVKLTGYNKYLLELSKTLPVIDTVGYVDNEGNYYRWSDSTQYTDLLDDYEKVQYNNIFDQANVNRDTFYIDGYVPQATVPKEEE